MLEAPLYLDEQGNPIDAPEFLDERGEPLQAESETSLTAPLVAAGAKAAPFVVAGINKAVPGVIKAVKGRAGAVAMGGALATGAGQAFRGDVTGAAKTAGGAAAMSQVPRLLEVLKRATAPMSGVLPSGAKYVLKKGAPITRAAGAASQFAGPLGLIASALFDDRRSPELRKLPPAGRDR